MNRYLLQLVIMASISMPIQIYADIQYRVSRLDPLCIQEKKEYFDTKYNRIKYLRYTVLAALAAGISYAGYTKLMTPSVKIADPNMLTAATLEEAVVELQKSNAALQDTVAVLSGKSLVNWFSTIMNHIVLGININTVCKIVVTPVLGRMMMPLLDLDEFWYQIRSEGDFVKGIISKARRLGAQQHLSLIIDDEKEDLCKVMQDSTDFLKKQIEKIIGFVRHKQGQVGSQHPNVLRQIDDQIRYLMLAYNDFADTLQEILNDSNRTTFDMSTAIIDCAQRFEQEYTVVKDYIRALESNLNDV